MNVYTRVLVNPRLKDISRLLEMDQRVMNDVVKNVDVVFRGHERSLFASEGTSGGRTWRALSPEYKKRKDRIFQGANATIRDLARVRGRRLTGSQVRKARGSDNKILQLHGDMKRAFSTQESGTSVHDGYEGVPWFHIASASRGGRSGAWILRHGAQGPGYFGFHADDPGRDPLQHTAEQWGKYFERMQRTMIPHVMQRVRAFAAWQRANRAA